MCTHCCSVRWLGVIKKPEVVQAPKTKQPDIISQSVDCFPPSNRQKTATVTHRIRELNLFIERGLG